MKRRYVDKSWDIIKKNGKKVGEVGERNHFYGGGGVDRFIQERARERRNAVSCSSLLHSYSFFLHISDKQWAFRIVLCEKMKKEINHEMITRLLSANRVTN